MQRMKYSTDRVIYMGDEAQARYDRHGSIREEVEVKINRPMPTMQACGRNGKNVNKCEHTAVVEQMKKSPKVVSTWLAKNHAQP
jgi:hypothetical protein